MGSMAMLPAVCITVTVMLAEALPDRAVMVAVPFITAVISPVALTVATALLLVDHDRGAPEITAFALS